MSQRKGDTPCFGCGDRQLGCHSKCEKYKEFQARNAKIRKRNQLDNACKDLNFRGKMQAQKEKYGRYIYGRQG